MEPLITLAITGLIITLVVIPYYRRQRGKERKARQKFEELKIRGLQAATSMHPHIDTLACIGCGACTRACPEGEVLAVIDGKSTLVFGSKCVGHGMCADVCPVGCITLLMAKPGRSAEFPILDDNYQTSVKDVYIVGELGGLALIKNAMAQGTAVIEHLSQQPGSRGAEYDVVIVGAGPAGMCAGLTAMKHKLRFALIDQGDAGGTILHYPRRKLVLTSPVEIPLWGKLKHHEIDKESLLDTWHEIIDTTGLAVSTDEKLTGIEQDEHGLRVLTSRREYSAKSVVLALGRRGTPRKLGVTGESLSKVMYQLIDAGTYEDCDVLVVGGGDSAIEAAIGLASQGTNRVTISYRKEEFTRIKERNAKRISDFLREGRLRVIFNSIVKEILPENVILQAAGSDVELKNDYVFVFLGGEPPYDLLRKIGIQFHQQVIQ